MLRENFGIHYYKLKYYFCHQYFFYIRKIELSEKIIG